MANLGCECKFGCIGLSIGASIIIGIITALFRISAVITVTSAFLWVVLGIAVVYLAVLLLSPIRTSSCACNALPVTLTGILGTALTSVILLAIPFVATSIVGAIITGALLLFVSLIITSSACLVLCKSGCND